jgi:predicted cobalt transporter CbtA
LRRHPVIDRQSRIDQKGLAVKRFVIRGALAGGGGGLASALFLFFVGERSIRSALAIEAARAARSDAVHTEMFSRGTQLIGGMLAALIYGVCIGVVFGVVFATVRHRAKLRDDFSRSLALGGVAFVTVTLVPFLKYPANPPGVGDPSTVNARTIAFLTLIAASVILAVSSWRTSRWMRARGVSDATRVALVGFGHAAAVGILYLLWPANPDAVPAPATLIWHFRIASLAGAALLWAVLATGFGVLSLRAEGRAASSPRPSLLEL